MANRVAGLEGCGLLTSHAKVANSNRTDGLSFLSLEFLMI
jgi:hypothetical protein